MNGIIVLAITILVIIFILTLRSYGPVWPYDPARAAGDRAEDAVAIRLKQKLYETDLLFTNVEIEYEGKKTEIDDLVVNRNGIFFIEVKYYSGTLYGEYEDREWTKLHRSGAGEEYYKKVKNPIYQVRRQEYLLSSYLKQFGIGDWVTGYVYFIENNSPISDDYILENLDEFISIIHRRSGSPLTKTRVDKISDLFAEYSVSD